MRRKGAIRENAIRISTASEEARNRLNTRAHDFYGIIGESQSLRTVLEHLAIVAPAETSVLILGESGTGKERIAECIHELSPRRRKPMIKVNCAALPVNLVESELFGHERGAFTGAVDKRIGKFEQAQDGTIFLDEIGELPLEIQVKFLRVLQEKEFERVGGNTVTKINVRIIAATNRDLEREVSEGRFRMDLYYRLNVFPLQLPPLRERKEDIPLLARHFMAHYAGLNNKTITNISDEVFDGLMGHNWPGNIRELEHTLERAVLMAQDETISKVVMPHITVKDVASTDHRIKSIEEVEREHILAVLKKCNGKISGKGGAADLLGINVSTLNSKIKKLGILRNSKFIKPD
jgi:transcriptional regulator with GAF, ATPase, and Fis domain